MSPSVVSTTPPATQAGILRTVAGSAHPKLELPNIAHRYGLTLDQLRAILNAGGYPEKPRMLAAAARLEEAAEYANDPAPGDQADDDTSTGTDSTGRLMHVPVDQLQADPDNVREHVGDITDLADSMVEAGLIQPIVARRHKGRLYVVAGHRRLAAARHLRWDSIDCIVRDDMRPDDVLAAMLIENGQRADLDPIEEARGLHRLKTQLDCSDSELGRRIGRNQAFVSNRLTLLSLSPEEQDAVRAGRLKLGAATTKARVDSGRIRPGAKGKKGPAHLSIHHDLGSRAQARCTQLKHSRAGSKSVGGVACGACWEAVIRADEREQLHVRSAKTGDCALCSAPVTTPAVSA